MNIDLRTRPLSFVKWSDGTALVANTQITCVVRIDDVDTDKEVRFMVSPSGVVVFDAVPMVLGYVNEASITTSVNLKLRKNNETGVFLAMTDTTYSFDFLYKWTDVVWSVGQPSCAADDYYFEFLCGNGGGLKNWIPNRIAFTKGNETSTMAKTRSSMPSRVKGTESFECSGEWLSDADSRSFYENFILSPRIWLVDGNNAKKRVYLNGGSKMLLGSHGDMPVYSLGGVICDYLDIEV